MDISETAPAAVETGGSEPPPRPHTRERLGDRDAGAEPVQGPIEGPSDRLVVMCDRRDWGGRAVRAAIAQHCAGRVAPGQIADAQLVASELLTNSLQHGAAGLVTVAVAISGVDVVVTVTSTEGTSRLPPPETWSFPEPSVPSQRGLAIVRALATSVEVYRTPTAGVDDRDWVGITARLGPPPGSDPTGGRRWRRYLDARVPFWVALLVAIGVFVLVTTP